MYMYLNDCILCPPHFLGTILVWLSGYNRRRRRRGVIDSTHSYCWRCRFRKGGWSQWGWRRQRWEKHGRSVTGAVATAGGTLLWLLLIEEVTEKCCVTECTSVRHWSTKGTKKEKKQIVVAAEEMLIGKWLKLHVQIYQQKILQIW